MEDNLEKNLPNYADFEAINEWWNQEQVEELGFVMAACNFMKQCVNHVGDNS